LEENPIAGNASLTLSKEVRTYKAAFRVASAILATETPAV